MNNNPLVSVIIPTYNRSKYLPRAINSVLNQTYKNLEIIIVDDGSSDNTKEILKPYIKDEGIEYFYIENSGVSNARNFGIQKANGEYISLLDSDDEYLSTRIEIQLSEMKKQEAIISLSNRITSIGGKYKKINPVNNSRNLSKEEIILVKVPPAASLIMFKKEVFKKVKFDKNLPASNDYDFLLTSFNFYDILYVDYYLTIIHKSLSLDRISTNYEGKIMGYNVVLDKLNFKVYKLNFRENHMLRQKLLLDLGLFNLLNKNNDLGRKYLRQYFEFEKVNSIIYFKFKIIYCISFIPFLLNFIFYIGRILWKKGMVKL